MKLGHPAGTVLHFDRLTGVEATQSVWVVVSMDPEFATVVRDEDPRALRRYTPGFQLIVERDDEYRVIPDDQVPGWFWPELARLRLTGKVA